jgi:hypothetical protein
MSHVYDIFQQLVGDDAVQACLAVHPSVCLLFLVILLHVTHQRLLETYKSPSSSQSTFIITTNNLI